MTDLRLPAHRVAARSVASSTATLIPPKRCAPAARATVGAGGRCATGAESFYYENWEPARRELSGGIILLGVARHWEAKTIFGLRGLAVLLLVGGCATSQSGQYQTAAKLSPADLGVSEAVVRALIPLPKYPVENPRPYRCVTSISVPGKDPPQEMLRNLRDVPCLLKAGSKFEPRYGDMLSSIKTIVWTSPELAEVEGNTYTDQYSAHGWAATVRRQEGVWAVMNLRVTWFS